MLIKLLVLAGVLLPVLVLGLKSGKAADASKRAVLHCLAAEELLMAGWLVPARREYERALRLQPMLGAAHFGLGQVSFSEGRYAEAANEYRAALATLHAVREQLGQSAEPAPAMLTAALAQAIEAERDCHQTAARPA